MTEKIQFYPIDFGNITINNKEYIRVFGRTVDNKRICVFDAFEEYFWVIPEKENIEWVRKQIENIKIEEENRIIYVKKAESHIKKFLGKSVKAIKVVMNNSRDLKYISSEVKKISGYGARKEIDIPLYKKYLIDNQITPLTLCEVFGNIIDSNLEVDICISGKITQISNDLIKNPKILSFDIETSGTTSSMQDCKFPIIMMGLAGSDGFRKCVTWKEFEGAKKEIEFVKNETELLVRFRDLIKWYKPDYIVGYYSDGFDWPYIKSRADLQGINLDLSLDGNKIRFNKRGVGSAVRIKGIPHIDVFRFIRNLMTDDVASGSLQTQSYSLDSVSKEILNEGKDPVDITKLKDVWEKGGQELENYCLYNLKDAELCLRVFERVLPNINELVKIISQSIYDVSKMTFGQLIENYLMKKTREFDELIPGRPTYNERDNRMHNTYAGGFVYEPKPGLYENIAVFDFRSLHPSIISAHNIGLSTLSEKNDDSNETPEIEGRKYYFNYKEEGFIPKIIKDLIQRRIRIKQIMKDDPVLKARSYTLKIIAAGFHGYMGYHGARWYSIGCAEGILSYARYYLQKLIAKSIEFGFDVIYGDSVDGKTKILIKKNGRIYEEYIETLFKKTDTKNASGKEYNFKNNIEVLTLDEKGNSVFKPLVYVMRHKCNKKMYRVNFTNNWHIDVTEDHSLIGYQNLWFNNSKKRRENPLSRIIEVKPTEIKKKLKSIVTLKHIPCNKILSKNYPKEVYEFMGYFIGDGSFTRNKPHQKSNKDYYLGLSLGKDVSELIEKLIKPLIKKGYIRNYWLSKTRKGDIKINGLKLIKLISQNCRDENRKKIIPKWLFEETEENIASFLKGLFSADGTVIMRKGNPIIRYTTINNNYVKDVRKLLYRIGISNSVFKENNQNIYKTKNKVYSSGSYSKHIFIRDKDTFLKKIGFILERKNKLGKIKTKEPLQRKHIKQFEFDIQGVKEIEEIKTPEYVYDIEVEDTHRFFANYALVHNTDSVFVKVNDKTSKDIEKFLNDFNRELPSLMNLELENYYSRGIFVMKKGELKGAKKKYALIDRENKIKIRGFETVRRDWSEIARESQNRVLDIILKDGDKTKAIDYVRDVINRLKDKKVSLDELKMSTQLKKDIDTYESIGPHVAVAKIMRSKGIYVGAGSIISYIVGEGSGMIKDRAVLFEDATSYDSDYYINHQVIPAVEKIFEVLGYQKQDLLSGEQTKLGEF